MFTRIAFGCDVGVTKGEEVAVGVWVKVGPGVWVGLGLLANSSNDKFLTVFVIEGRDDLDGIIVGVSKESVRVGFVKIVGMTVGDILTVDEMHPPINNATARHLIMYNLFIEEIASLFICLSIA